MFDDWRNLSRRSQRSAAGVSKRQRRDKRDLDWTPRTLEDRLLELYLADHSGTLFLEVEVGGSDGVRGPRRLDGVLVPGSSSNIRPRFSYSREELEEAVQGALDDVHVRLRRR